MSKSQVWCPDPGEVEMVLRLAGPNIVYPRNAREVNRGYAHLQVIPTLYDFVTSCQRVPTPEESCNHLWQLREHEEKYRDEIKRRTIKLVLDFYRELHTFGLLAKHVAFGLVTYAGAVDIDLGVDYTASLSLIKMHWLAGTCVQDVGIQARIGGRDSRSPVGYYVQSKENRRRARGAGSWPGVIYELNNANRPALICKPTNTWLFTPGHINDLVNAIVHCSAIGIVVSKDSDQ